MKLVLNRSQPRASASYVSIKATATYVRASVFLYLDERGLNKFARDYLDPTDVATFLFGKGLADTQSVSEALSFATAKLIADEDNYAEDEIYLSIGYIRSYADTATSVDALLGLLFGKGLLDTVGTSDGITGIGVGKLLDEYATLTDLADVNNGDGLEYSIGKGITDYIDTPSDATLYALSKSLEDAASSDEALAYAMSKPLADTYSASEQIYNSIAKGTISDDSTTSDSFDRSVQYDRTQSDSVGTATSEPFFTAGKGLADTATMSEAYHFDITALYTDAATSSDITALSLSRGLSDAATSSDAESHVVAFARQFADTVGYSDSSVNTTGKSLSETLTSSSSGEFRMTDYWDITYCSEDYVGSYRTFT